MTKVGCCGPENILLVRINPEYSLPLIAHKTYQETHINLIHCESDIADPIAIIWSSVITARDFGEVE